LNIRKSLHVAVTCPQLFVICDKLGGMGQHFVKYHTSLRLFFSNFSGNSISTISIVLTRCLVKYITGPSTSLPVYMINFLIAPNSVMHYWAWIYDKKYFCFTFTAFMLSFSTFNRKLWIYSSFLASSLFKSVSFTITFLSRFCTSSRCLPTLLLLK
jgi:hypothetical protein